MIEIPKGRIFQSENFEIPWFQGVKLEELIGMEDPNKENREPIVIYIKGEGLSWNQFFLDASFGFWENWGRFEFEKEEADNWYKNYTEEFEIRNEIVKNIFCIDSQFNIIFDNGKEIILRYGNPKDFESDCELIFKSVDTI